MNRPTEGEYVRGQEDPGKNLVDLFKITASYKIFKLHDVLKYTRFISQCSTLRYTRSVREQMSQYNRMLSPLLPLNHLFVNDSGPTRK